MGLLKKVQYYFALIRWKNLLIVGFTQVFVFYFLSGTDEKGTYLDLLMVVLSTLLIAGAGYLINDYSDIKIDVVNKPEKLIVGKYISRREALALHISMNMAGIIMAGILDPYFGLICIVISFLLWQYSINYKYKFLLGNLCVSGLMAASLMVVAFASKDIDIIWLGFYSTFAFLTGLIREIVKDVEDMEGDAQYNCRTIPIVMGVYRTKLVLYYLSLAGISLLILSVVYLFQRHYYILPAYLLCITGVPMLVFFIRLINADAKRDFSKLSTFTKYIMIAGVLSMSLRGLS